MPRFTPIVDNPDLSIHEAPMQPGTAVVCRWKDAHRYRRKHPDVAVVGPLRTVRGIDLLFRSLLANPQIKTVYVEGVDLTPGESTTDALFDTWSGNNEWLGDDVIPHAHRVRDHVSLVELERNSEMVKIALYKETPIRDKTPIVLPPPKPKATDTAPHGDPGERVVGDTLAELWPRALQQALHFGNVAPTQYGETKEVLNLVSVIRDPVATYTELAGHDWIPGHDQLDIYADRLYVLRTPPEGAKYSYSSRFHGASEGAQLDKLYAMLKSSPGTRAAYVTPWNADTDAGLESGRPCLVGAWFRLTEATSAKTRSGSSVLKSSGGQLHLTVMFRSHDLFGAYPLNLASACRWLEHTAGTCGFDVGTLTCLSASAHIYDRDYAAAEEVVSERLPKTIGWDPRSTWRVELQNKVELRVLALSPDGERVVGIFEGKTPAAVRAKIERAGLIQSVGNALWLGAEIERVYGNIGRRP